MEQLSQGAVGYCLLGLIGRQIRHSSSHLRRSAAELHAVSMQKELLLEIVKIPPEEYSTWQESLRMELRVLADHVEAAKKIVDELTLDVSIIRQEVQASESGAQLAMKFGEVPTNLENL